MEVAAGIDTRERIMRTTLELIGEEGVRRRSPPVEQVALEIELHLRGAQAGAER